MGTTFPPLWSLDTSDFFLHILHVKHVLVPNSELLLQSVVRQVESTRTTLIGRSSCGTRPSVHDSDSFDRREVDVGLLSRRKCVKHTELTRVFLVLVTTEQEGEIASKCHQGRQGSAHFE